MTNYSLKGIADELASRGRYGDTMLVHMNPYEVQGLASLVPGGKLTINPDTGQPEAFLPFLLPVLGGIAGSFAGPALGMTALMGGALGAGLGGLGGGLASGRDFGSSLGQGIASGLLSYGLGSALGGLADAGASGATAAMATPAASAASGAASVAPLAGSESAVSHALEQAAQAGLNVPAATPAVPAAPAPTPMPQIPQGFNGMTNTPGLPDGLAGMDPSRMGWNGDPTAMAPLGTTDLIKNKFELAAQGISPQGLWDTFGKNAMKTTVPIGLGLMGMDTGSAAPATPAPPPVGLEPYRNNRPNTISVRGQRVSPPPGYRPGTDPEWNYFPRYQKGGKVNYERDPRISIDDGREDPDRGPTISLEEAEEQLQELLQIELDNMGMKPIPPLESPNPFDRRPNPVMRFARGGRAISGPGGGLADMVPASIDGRQPARLSSGEYVVPAHAVSAMGDGSTEEGVRQMDRMVDDVMTHKFGTKNRRPNPMKKMKHTRRNPRYA